MDSQSQKGDRLHRIVVDFGDTKVAKKYDRPIWDGFRIWESVKWPIPNRPEYETIRRMANVGGNPPFDILCDRLMDFASIAAAALGRRDWENFRRLLLVHIADCPSKCWYCFNDAWDVPRAKCTVDAITAEEIVRHFKAQQARDKKIEGKQCNVLRLSGGEPFREPGLVEDLAREIRQYDDVFFWVDTNLMPIARKKNKEGMTAALEALGQLEERAAIHACFHGATDEKIIENTGLTDVSVHLLLDAYDELRNKIRVYPRLNPCTCTPEDAEKFFLQLYERDKMGPAKVYLGPIELYYQPARDRMKEVKNIEARQAPKLHPGTATIFWWNRMMQIAYGVGYGVVPRHLCDCLCASAKMSQQELANELERDRIRRDRPDHEFIFISKGSGRENYALKVLEALALPVGAHMTLELEGKYVEPNLREHAQIFPEVYKSKSVLIVATHDEGRGAFHISALRWARLQEILTTPSATTLQVELRSYPSRDWNTEESAQSGSKSGVEAYDFLARYAGRRNLPIDGYFCQLMALPNIWSPRGSEKPAAEQEAMQSEAFLQAVECLNEAKDDRLKSNAYYRVASVELRVNGKWQPAEFEDGKLRCHPRDRIRIKLDTFNRNLGRGGYPEESMAVLQVECTEPEVKIVSQNRISLSKFGHPVIELSVPAQYRHFVGNIVLRKAVEGARMAEVRLPFATQVEESS